MKQDRVRQIQSRSLKVTRSRNRVICLQVLVALCWFVSSCAEQKQDQPLVEAPPPTTQPAQAAGPVQLPKLSSPKLIEVQEAVKRVFKDAAVIDSSASPNFVAGDFNGDLSQDIVVVVKVAPGKVAEMNEEFPTWVLRDPLSPTRPRMRLQVEENESLLAVIHGHGANDWRDPQATQTYLLKNAVGSRLEVQTGKEFVAANSKKKLPLLHGDLIGEVLRGSSGYIYYNGESYVWYDPKTFKGEPPRPFVHSRRTRA